MERTLRMITIAVAMLGLAACGEPPEQEHKSTLYVFGTQVEIIMRGVDAATAEAATAKLSQDFDRMHQDWHAWKPGELSDLNAAFKVGQRKTVTPFLQPLILQAKAFYELSDGLFNPAIGAIIGAWGFHADEKPKEGRPDLDVIHALAAQKPSMDNVTVVGDEVSSSNPSVQLDFGGLAKGVALDHAEQVLKSLGINDALVNAGGDINTLPANRSWKVGIRDPKAWGVIATVTLKPGEDIYTSGNYERFREIDGVRYAHIIDPRDGMPVAHIVSATVIAQNGALADAAATALTVAGPHDWHRIAKRMGIKYAVLVDDKGTVYMNPAMRARVVFTTDLAPTIVESLPLF